MSKICAPGFIGYISYFLLNSESCASNITMISQGPLEAWHPVYNNIFFKESGYLNNRKVYTLPSGYGYHNLYYAKATEGNPGGWMVIISNYISDIYLKNNNSINERLFSNVIIVFKTRQVSEQWC